MSAQGYDQPDENYYRNQALAGASNIVGGTATESQMIHEARQKQIANQDGGPRKESEVDMLLNDLEKELEILSMSANGFISNVSEGLSAEQGEDKTESDKLSPSSPLGRRIFQSTYKVHVICERINDANKRVRI